jgi:hypothetical protein
MAQNLLMANKLAENFVGAFKSTSILRLKALLRTLKIKKGKD